MPRRKRPAGENPDRMREVAETAFRVLREAIGERPKAPPPGERSHAWKHRGAVSGKAQADALTPDDRSEHAREAARNRWAEKEYDG